ncbi:MAG TPA: ATP-binding cassette domain-containing protein [Abditibacteriaceae bacterium]|nr:ATP-binding cassette domain-containing protein [Abditibacteriaceae bacterium]
MALINLRDVRISFGNAPVLDGIQFQIEPGERVCLVGRNGEGKSTLLKLISRELAPDSGDISLQKGARVASLSQEVPDDISGRVREVVSTSPDESHHQAEDYEVEAALHRLDLDADAEFETLSGGLKRRVLLARALVSQPDLLLLDEPTNHLDIESILWMEDFLLRAPCAVLFVTHDRQFLQRLATRIVEIDRGKLSSWSCDYNTYLERKAAMLEAEANQNALFDKKLAQEEVWVRKGVKARTTRNEGRVRELQRLRQERSQRREISGMVRIEVQQTERSGHKVIEARNASYSYNADAIEYSNGQAEAAAKPILRDFSTLVMRGDKVGIIGPNGAGKTTMLRLMLGQLKPQSGEIKLGTRLQIAYFDQLRAQLEDDKSVQYNVAGENDTVLVNGERRHIIGYLQEWLFSPERARTKAGVLSGGERNRLLLAKLFTQPSNILVMDEPTNDLDIETLDLLEDLLVNYAGTLLIVSHDRAFLNNVATSTIAPLGDGKWRETIGGYDDYIRQSQNDKTALEARNASQKPAVKTSTTKQETTKTSTSRPRKMSFKETRELQELPSRIEKLEAEHAALIESLGNPELYKSNPAEAAQSSTRLAQIEAETTVAFARWEELEAMQTANLNT